MRDAAAARGEPEVAPPLLETCDRAKLDAALQSPRAAFGGTEKYPTLIEKAAALAYHLAKAHACVKGNKRTTAALTVAFLKMNGLALRADALRPAEMVSLAASSQTADEQSVLDQLAAWLEQDTVRL